MGYRSKYTCVVGWLLSVSHTSTCCLLQLHSVFGFKFTRSIVFCAVKHFLLFVVVCHLHHVQLCRSICDATSG